MNDNIRQDVQWLLEAAAKVHGHACPSLAYGSRLAAMLLDRLPPGTGLAGLVIHHTSSCFRDGVTTVLRISGSPVEPVSVREPGRCALEATWEGGGLRLSVKEGVRRRVDGIKGHLDLEAFRQAGVNYLMTLSDEEFADIVPQPPPED